MESQIFTPFTLDIDQHLSDYLCRLELEQCTPGNNTDFPISRKLLQVSEIRRPTDAHLDNNIRQAIYDFFRTVEGGGFKFDNQIAHPAVEAVFNDISGNIKALLNSAKHVSYQHFQVISFMHETFVSINGSVGVIVNGGKRFGADPGNSGVCYTANVRTIDVSKLSIGEIWFLVKRVFSRVDIDQHLFLLAQHLHKVSVFERLLREPTEGFDTLCVELVEAKKRIIDTCKKMRATGSGLLDIDGNQVEDVSADERWQ